MTTGRAFAPEEDHTAGTHPVAVISYGLWRSEFGSDPAVLGRTVVVNGQDLIIVGVTDQTFRGIESEAVDIWTPLAMAAHLGLRGGAGGDWRMNPFTAVLRFVGRRASTVNPQTVAAQASEALTRTALPELDPSPQVLVGSLTASSGPNRPATADLALWAFAVTGILLAMTCSNAANLSLARSTWRRREMASRLALGASPRRLVGQVLAESLLLTALGAAAGFFLALLGSNVASRFPLPIGAIEPNVRLLGFAGGVALIAGAVPALVSARSVLKADPVRWLKETRSMADPRHHRTRLGLLVVQVALSVLLLIGAGLFVRSLDQVASVNSGLDVERLYIVTMDLSRSGFEPAVRKVIQDAARERLLQIPGVHSVSAARYVPLEGLRYATDIRIAGHGSPDVDTQPFVTWVGGRYFETVGAELLRGRGIQDDDRAGTPPVAVVNEVLARMLMADADPDGFCLEIPNRLEGACARVIGVVRDHRVTYLDPDVPPIVYLAWDQHAEPASTIDPYLVVRVGPDEAGVSERIRQVVQSVRPDLPFVAVEALEDRLALAQAPFRLGAELFSIFAALALIVVTLGVYGVVSYIVSLRGPEIAIRRSLGATGSDVVRLVIRQTMIPVVAGIAIGVGAGYLGGGLVEALLYGVSARDPLAYIGAAAFLGGVSLLASYVPTRRAVKTDPMTMLRAE